MTIYEVMTFYGTCRKYFHSRSNAIRYATKLKINKSIDPDLIEVYKSELPEDDLNDIVFED